MMNESCVFSIGINVIVASFTPELNRLLHIAQPEASDKKWEDWFSFLHNHHGYIITCHDDTQNELAGVIVITPVKTSEVHLYHMHLLSVNTIYTENTQKMIRESLMSVCADILKKVNWDHIPFTEYQKDIFELDMQEALQTLTEKCGKTKALYEVTSIIHALATGVHFEREHINTVVQKTEVLLREVVGPDCIATLREIVYGAHDRASLLQR